VSAAPAALVTEHLQRDAVLITGCSSGIGEATALLLARGGMLVFANVRRAEDGEALVREGGDNLRPLVFDVSDADGIERARATVAAEPGIVLRAVVNNAGIGSAGPLEILPLDEIRKLMEVNYIGPLAVTKAFLPLLHESRGRLINVTSIAGKFAAPFGGAYAASKFAYEAASDALRLELAPFGIRVIVVEPGAIKTKFWERGSAAAEAMAATLPAGALVPYQPYLERFRAVVLDSVQKAIAPERVAATIAKALVATRPRARYVVGADARLQLVLARLPEPVRDAVVRRALGLGTSA
jgi:NAD(P)-dependent dehydrogenase (short-subunit alcohol dehydrogenase family)